MGHNKKMTKLDVQKEQLKKVFIKLLETNEEIMNFQITLTDKIEEKKGLKKLAKKTRHAIDVVRGIDHYELLISLYNMFINKKEPYFLSLCSTVCSKDLQKWDKTEKGFQEFLRLEQEAINDYNKKQEESRKQAEMIKNAREEGKKVEMVYKNGKITPIIVEDKPN